MFNQMANIRILFERPRDRETEGQNGIEVYIAEHNTQNRE